MPSQQLAEVIDTAAIEDHAQRFAAMSRNAQFWQQFLAGFADGYAGAPKRVGTIGSTMGQRDGARAAASFRIGAVLTA